MGTSGMAIGTFEMDDVILAPSRRGDHMNEVLYDPASYNLLERLIPRRRVKARTVIF